MSDILGIGRAVKHGYHEVSHEGSQIGHEIESGVMQVKHTVESGVLQIRQETEKGVHTLKGALPDIPGEVEKALEKALQEFFKALASPLLKQYAKLLEVATPDTVWLSIGPITFTVSKVAQKFQWLKDYAENPPTNKEQIKDFLVALAPDDVEVALKVNVPGTQSLTAGATLIYLKDNFEKRFEEILSTIELI